MWKNIKIILISIRYLSSSINETFIKFGTHSKSYVSVSCLDPEQDGAGIYFKCERSLRLLLVRSLFTLWFGHWSIYRHSTKHSTIPQYQYDFLRLFCNVITFPSFFEKFDEGSLYIVKGFIVFSIITDTALKWVIPNLI